MGESSHVMDKPRLYDIFDIPKITSIRAKTKLHLSVDLETLLRSVTRAKRIKTANQNIVKFELKRGAYLLLFPSGYVEVHAPDEGTMREVLIAFRDELAKHKIF
jgi:hypothetical protein